MIQRVKIMSLTRKTEPACMDVIQVTALLEYCILYLFCTSYTAIWNRKYKLSCFISGNIIQFENYSNACTK